MTVYCEICGKPPLNYITVDNRILCFQCGFEEYKLKLKELKLKYIGVSD